MANHKSAIKAHKISLINRERNISMLSKMKTFIKKVEEQIVAKNFADAKAALIKAESEIMKTVSSGVLKKSTASRKVSRLTRRVKQLEAQ